MRSKVLTPMGLVVLQLPPWSDLPTNGIESPADSASDSLDGGVSSASSAWLQRFVGGIWSSFISSSSWYPLSSSLVFSLSLSES